MMPDVINLLEPGTLEQPPPRRLPPWFLINLLGEHLLARPARDWLDPFLISWVLAVAALYALGAGVGVLLVLVLLFPVRLLIPSSRLLRDVRDDYLLMRHGLIVTAHIIGIRPAHTANSTVYGAYLDCAIPLSPRRTTVGSVWIPDRAEAQRLSEVGSMPVICLARAPGVWRLRDGDGAQLRYEPAQTDYQQARLV
ncbi:MAG: hypothetical protein AB4911_03405 [Oscillochloridaceae bacterium umkhey_bin13]